MTAPENNARLGRLDGLKREIREFVNRLVERGAPESWVSQERPGYSFRLTATNTPGTYQVIVSYDDTGFATLLLLFLQEKYGASNLDHKANKGGGGNFTCLCNFAPAAQA